MVCVADPELARTAELVPCVVYTPPSIGLAPSTAAPPREPKAYADFLDVFVSEHGRHFQWVELWNEPNNLNDWDWRLDPDWSIFCTMVGGAAYWMRQRGKRTVLGGTCPTDPPLLELLRQKRCARANRRHRPARFSGHLDARLARLAA